MCNEKGTVNMRNLFEQIRFGYDSLCGYDEEIFDLSNEEMSDELIEDEYDDLCYKLPVARCPYCNTLVRADEVEEGKYCPLCYEDLTKEFEELEE